MMAWKTPELVTAQQLAAQLQVSKKVITNARLSGKLTGILIGREYRYRPEDIEAYLDRQTVRAEQ